jgi:hypothetical protein
MQSSLFFLLPTKGQFLSAYDNDALKSQADALWRHVDDTTSLALAITISVGVVICILYYGPFNNFPGRHYRIRYWFLFAAIAVVATFGVIWALEYWGTSTNLKSDAYLLYTKCALSCAIWEIVVYWGASLIYCLGFGRYTNAYKII